MSKAALLSLAHAIITCMLFSSCSDDKSIDTGKENRDEKTGTNDQPESMAIAPIEDNDKPQPRSSFSILEHLHKDTVLERVRLPGYDERFAPKSLLTAKTMKVINGQTIEAEDVSMELYKPDGSIKARTKIRHATYRKDSSVLEGMEAIWIDGHSFEVSGTGLYYDTVSGRGLVLGPVSTLFEIKQTTGKGKTDQ